MSSVSSKKSKSKSADKVPAVKSPRERLDEIGIEALCAFVESGESISAFGRVHSLATSTIHDWIDDTAHPDRAAMYARAKEARADNVFESLDDVSDQAVSADNPVTVQGLRLKADNIKWKLARMHKKYSDRTVLAGDPEAPLNAGPKVDLSQLSDAELQTYLALQRKLEGVQK